jgi:tetratricopeptide (TPR) repeat protein
MGQSKSKQAAKFFKEGNSFFEKNAYNKAISSYDQAIKMDSTDLKFYLNKGNALNALHQYSAAIKCYDEVIEIDPLYYLAYYNKGNLMLNNNHAQNTLKV